MTSAAILKNIRDREGETREYGLEGKIPLAQHALRNFTSALTRSMASTSVRVHGYLENVHKKYINIM